MTKILFITNHSYMFYQFRRDLVLDLLKDGYQVTLCTPFNGHEEDFVSFGCKVIETPFERRGINPKQEMDLYRNYVKILEEEKPDFVLTYSIKPNVYGGLACTKLNIPYAINVQGLGTAFEKQGMKQVAGALYKRACKNAKVVFFENKEDEKFFRNRGIVSEKQCVTLPGAGVNTSYFKYTEPVEHDKFHFLYLGRIMKEKGVNELFEAMRWIHEEYPDSVLDIVGFPEEDHDLVISELVKDGIAVYHGFQPDPRPYYAMADCVVLPSYHEGMSNVLLEAAAIGRMVITTDTSGCREAVDLDKTGYLSLKGSSISVYREMKKVLAMTPEERKEAGILARAKMISEFEKGKVVEMTRKACGL